MSDASGGPPPGSAGERGRLDSWKEIAAFLGRGIRTVQRWERDEGLPVHRLAHAERGSVFADPAELTAWWKSRQIAPPARSMAPGGDIARARLQRVTSTSAATFWPSLSSDGRMVVYVSDAGQDGTMPQLWLQQVGGAAVQLTTGMRECAEPAFSADDTRVIFNAAADSTRHIYEIPALGGQPRVLKRAARNGRFSPDGRWLAYLAIDSGEVRLASSDGEERVPATGLEDVMSVTWSDDSRHLLVVGHRDSSAERDCWIVPVDGGAPVDTGALGQARRRELIVISMAIAWMGDSIFFTAAGRPGIHLWRQRISPRTFEAIGPPELMTPGTESAFFPTGARQRLAFVGVHTDTNLWSVGIDPRTGRAEGAPRRLTRGAAFVSHFSVSRDGHRLAYFAAGPGGAALRIRDVRAGTDTPLDADTRGDRGFPVISLDGTRLAFGMMVPGPPLRRPVFVATLADGESRQISDDCGGRPRLWLDEDLLLAEMFAAGSTRFDILDTRSGAQRPLLVSSDRRLSNPRLSPDARWLAFDATPLSGTPSVFVARLDDGHTADEPAWILIEAAASHPFWSRDGRLLYYLPTTPTVDIRNRVVARAFDPQDGRVGSEQIDVLSLSETIVPAMVASAAPIVAGDQIVFLLGNYRGDIWMMDLPSRE